MFDLTLTFDNGPEPGVTPRVLDTLAERGIKSTFFVIGEKLGDPERKQIAMRAHDEGHWIGNHTFTHTVPLGQQRDAATAQNEIGRTQAEIGDLTHPNRWFRPFGGGGNLDDRLLKPSVVDYLTKKSIAACSGTPSRATGTIRTAGSNGRCSSAGHSRGA